jgi:hypothetical protein
VPYIGQQPAPKVVTSSDLADDVVTADKIGDTAISGFTALGAEPADTDELLISDAGTLKRLDYSYIKGGGKHTLLSTTTISNAAQVDIEANIDSTYSKYYFKLSKLFCATDNAYLLGRLKVGGSYQTDSNYEYVNTDTRTNGTNFDNGSTHSTSATYLIIQNANGQGNASTESFDHDIWLSNPADTAIHKFIWGLGQGWRSEHAMCQHRFFGSYTGSASAITGVRFYMNTGNISSGTIQLYGIV